MLITSWPLKQGSQNPFRPEYAISGSLTNDALSKIAHSHQEQWRRNLELRALQCQQTHGDKTTPAYFFVILASEEPFEKVWCQ
jgi:hypothetical protein